MIVLAAAAVMPLVGGSAGAQVLTVPRKTTPVPPYSPPVLPIGRVPSIGRLPLFATFDRIGTSCVESGDTYTMAQQGIARGWNAFGAASRHSFVGVDSRGRVRYIMDSMQDQMGPMRDREQATVQFYSNGRVEIGRRGAWTIDHDAAYSWPQVTGLFGADSSRAFAFAYSLARHCSGGARIR